MEFVLPTRVCCAWFLLDVLVKHKRPPQLSRACLLGETRALGARILHNQLPLVNFLHWLLRGFSEHRVGR